MYLLHHLLGTAQEFQYSIVTTFEVLMIHDKSKYVIFIIHNMLFKVSHSRRCMILIMTTYLFLLDATN